MATAWQHWDSIDRKDAPVVYVHTVLINTSRRWRRRRWVGELPTAELPERAVADHVAELVERDAIANALRALPTRQRAVLGLRYISDLSEQQTAQVLGCAVSTVKSQASKGLQRLRRAPGLVEEFARGESDD